MASETAGHRLEAPDVAAPAHDVVVVADVDVADVAGRAVGAAVHWPPATMPDPMPVPILTKSRKSSSRQFTQCSPTAMMFTSLSTSAGTPNRCESRSLTR